MGVNKVEYMCTIHQCTKTDSKNKKCCFFCVNKGKTCKDHCTKDPNKCRNAYISSLPQNK